MHTLLHMDYADILKKDIGELTQTIENDSEQLLQFYLLFLLSLMKNVLFVIGVIIVGLLTDVWIGLLLLVMLCVLYIVFRYINKVAQKRWERTKNEYQKLFSVFSKINVLMNEMMFINKEEYLKSILLKRIKAVFHSDLMSSMVSYELWMSTILGFGSVKIFVLIFGVLMNINLGVIYLFVYYIDVLNDPIEELRIQLENIPSTLESRYRVSNLINIKSNMSYGNSILNAPITTLNFHNVQFAYRNHVIFHNFNLTLTSGKIYGLVGRSGSGKTTLINLIARLYDVDKGEITINDKPISNYQKGELSKQIEYIGQNEIFMLSKDEILHYLHTSNLVNLKDIFDFDLSKELSLGQSQYVYVCKALCSEKSILMLDEIFTHMDNFKVQKVFDILKTQHKIIIIITHESEIMLDCDELIRLEDDTYAH